MPIGTSYKRTPNFLDKNHQLITSEDLISALQEESQAVSSALSTLSNGLFCCVFLIRNDQTQLIGGTERVDQHILQSLIDSRPASDTDFFDHVELSPTEINDHLIDQLLITRYSLEESEIAFGIVIGLKHSQSVPQEKLTICNTAARNWGIAMKAKIKNTQLQTERNYYHSLINKVDDMIYEMDGSGVYTFANLSAQETLNYSYDQLTTMSYHDVVHPEDLVKVKDYHKQLIANNKSSGYIEFRIVGADGAVYWIGQNSSLQYEEGQLVAVRAVARNITDLVFLREELEQSEKLYKLVTENSRDMICLTKLDGTFLFLSPYVKELLGFEPYELEGTNGYDLFHPEDLKRIKSEARYQNKFLNTAQYRFKRKDGTYVWVETVNRLIVENGEVEIFQSSTRDISQRKAAQLKAEQTGATLASMMENTNDIIFALDLESRFLYFNSAYRDIYFLRTGKNPEIGEKYEYPIGDEKFNEVFNKVMDGERVSMEAPVKFRDGTEVLFQGNFSPITDDHGKPIGGSAFLKDITEANS